MIVNELFGFPKRSNNSYTNNPYAVMSQPAPAPVPADEPTVTDTEPNIAPASSIGNMTRQLAARGQSQTSTGGATIATGRGVRHAASPLNPNQQVYPSATKPAAQPAATAEPSLDLLKRATASLQGGPALSAAELQQVNSYRKSQGEPAMPAATAAQPAGFNAANVMKMPGMEKYAKPAAPAKTPNFAGPGGYGKVTTSFKPVTPAATKVPVTPAAPKQPITIGGQKILPTDPAYDKIMGKATVESLAWSKNFDPGMTLLRKMRK